MFGIISLLFYCMLGGAEVLHGVKTFKCCFTGYRPAKFPFRLSQGDSEYVKFENALVQGILGLISMGCDTFYTGMAMGFDIIAAEAVLLLKNANTGYNIKLVCVVPFRGQGECFNDYWQGKYNNILNRADEIITLSESYHTGCYQVRNKYMVDNCDYVLTWFDGKSGGTRNTLNYAASKQRQILNVYDDTCENFAVQTAFELI